MSNNSVRLSRQVVPSRYKIEITPDLEGFLFSGKEEVYIALYKPTRLLVLHARALLISKESVLVSLGKLNFSVETIVWNERQETVTFTFKKPIPKGHIVLSLAFQGKLDDALKGFYRSKYKHGKVHKHMAVTQFEATDARGAFPCFDEPALKAVFEVAFILPEHLTAISNTIAIETKKLPEGKKRMQFSPTPKMSTYLVAFVVGEFESIETKTKKGVLVRVFVTPGKKHQAEFALKTAVKCLEFFEDFYGIAYPLPSMDLIGVPDFAAGAMENWGAVTYRESQLLVDPDHSSTVTKQWVALTVAHELAHQWFGNLVTMEWWTHLWLNEGFASYMEYVAIDTVFPTWDIWKQFVYIDFNSGLELDSLATTHPVEVEVKHPDEIGEIFDAISYHKGASIVRMLAEYLGEKDFRKGLHLYLKTHAYANAETSDLWKALQKASGKPVVKLMDTWIKKPGYPSIQIVESKRGLKISQSRFFSSPVSRKKAHDRTVWGVPLDILDSKNRVTKVFLNKKQLQLNLPKNTEWLKLNSGEKTPVRVDYPKNLFEKLFKPIEDKSLPALDRLGVVRDAFALSESGQFPTVEALELTKKYRNETDYNVWAELTVRLSEVKTVFYDQSWYEKLRKLFLDIYSPMVGVVGFAPKKNEKHQDTLLRALILGQAGWYGHEEVIAWAKKVFKSKNFINPDLRGIVYHLAVRFGSDLEFNTLLKRYKTEDMAEERNRLIRALGQTRNKTNIKKLLELQSSGKVRLQDGPTFMASLWSNAVARDLTWSHLKKNWKHFEATYGQGGHTLDRVVLMARVFNTRKNYLDFKKFFAKNSARGAERAVKQVLEQVEANVEWIKRESGKIGKYLI